jgi:hypothetical protein
MEGAGMSHHAELAELCREYGWKSLPVTTDIRYRYWDAKWEKDGMRLAVRYNKNGRILEGEHAPVGSLGGAGHKIRGQGKYERIIAVIRGPLSSPLNILGGMTNGGTLCP